LAGVRPEASGGELTAGDDSGLGSRRNSDEIDLGDVFRQVWARRWLVLAMTVASFFLGILYLNFATYRYTASQTVTPTDADTAVMTSRLGALSDLAKIGGINLPSSNNVFPFMIYTESLRSRNAANLLANDDIIMKRVFEREWNPSENKFEEPKSTLRTFTGAIQKFLGLPRTPWKEPDGARLQEYMQKNVTVVEDPKKPFVTIKFEHKDPEFAVYFVRRLHEEIDNQLRQNALKRSEDSIRYLSDQLSRVTLAEHREALAVTLSEQEKSRMSASRSGPFAADIFAPAAASRRPTSPNVILVLMIAVFGGFAVALATALVLRR
jgi:uncharacterized protein involved in exopolysaccharide biosynthesis